MSGIPGLLLIAALFGGAAALPLTGVPGSWITFTILVLYAALLGQAWNILGGFGGQFSFGHAAFFGTGAYAVAVTQTALGVNPWLGLVLGAALGAAVAAAIGALVFRYGLKGSYFALVTLAFAEVLRILSNSVGFTGAGVGILIPLDQRPANLQFAEREGYLWLIAGLAFLAFATAWWLRRSRFGAQLMALRDNEDAARALGVDVFRVKVGAMAISGAFTGAAGVFYAQYFLYLDPGIAYGPAVSVEALLVPIIGGIGTVLGPLLGALALHGLSDATRAFFGEAPGLNLVLYGALLVVMVTFLPRGIAGLGAVSARRLFGRGE